MQASIWRPERRDFRTAFLLTTAAAALGFILVAVQHCRLDPSPNAARQTTQVNNTPCG
ncbi:MAG: hypothetical protein ACRDVZ_16610 [Jiangellaceae bacterium]